MFESLTEKLGGIWHRLMGKHRPTEEEGNDILRQSRSSSSLETDVNFQRSKTSAEDAKKQAERDVTLRIPHV